MLVGEFITVVRESLNIQSDDTLIHDELIYQVGKAIRNELIRQETDKGKLINEGQLYPMLPLVRIDFANVPGLASGVTVLRAELPLPAVLDNKTSGKLINLVYTPTGIIIYPTELVHWLSSQRRIHSLSIPKYLIIDDLLHVVNYDETADRLFVNVDALYENPEEVDLAKAKESDCLSILDTEFFLPGFLTHRVVRMTRDTLSERYQLPNDKLNNAQEDLN